MTDWAELERRLDAAVFDRLADDAAAPWMRGGVELGRVGAILDRVERPATRNGLALIETADVVRISVAAAEASAPGIAPAAGDVFMVKGAAKVVHGQPWRDEQVNGRDWLCPVTAAG